MADSSSPKPKDFPHPLNEWIEEDVDVTVNEPVFEGGKVTIKQRIEKQSQKTIYINAPKKKLSCKDADHYFDIVDVHTYEARCRYCMNHKFLIPAFHDLVDGKIVSRQQ